MLFSVVMQLIVGINETNISLWSTDPLSVTGYCMAPYEWLGLKSAKKGIQ